MIELLKIRKITLRNRKRCDFFFFFLNRGMLLNNTQLVALLSANVS